MQGLITFLQGFRRTAEGRPTGGFGFIRDEAGRDRFFNRQDLVAVAFDQLREGQTVQFVPKERSAEEMVALKARGKGDNGLLAVQISVLAA